MIIFAPIKNITPENITDVFVHDFWSYSEQLKIFIPFGMTFEQIPRLNNQFVGFPNSEIELMSFMEYKALLKKTKRNLALFVWSKINRSEDPIDVINNKNIYIYTDSIDSFENLITGFVVPRSLTEPYDLSDGEEKNKHLEKILELFEELYNEYMPRYTPAIDASFDQDNLFLTCCRFEQESKKLFDCNKLLFFELTFLRELYTRLIFPGIDPLNIFAFSRRRVPNTLPKTPMPDCEKCSGFTVYCNRPWDDIETKIAPIREEKGLILIPTPEDDIGYGFLFKNLKEANQYFDETLNNEQTKYLCLPKVQVAMGPVIEYECKELLEPCAMEYIDGDEDEDMPLYDSEEECEENCNKKWYCLEYQCTKVDKNSQLVEGLEGYDSEEKCEMYCKIPDSSSSSSQNPYYDDVYE
jgi:hypothetical protein